MDPLSRLLQEGTFFQAKNRPKPPFSELRMATMIEVFDGAVVEKTLFVNFQRSHFVYFCQ